MGRGRPPPGRSKSPRPAPSRRGVPSKPRLAKPPVSTTACHAGPPTSMLDTDANHEQHTHSTRARVCAGATVSPPAWRVGACPSRPAARGQERDRAAPRRRSTCDAAAGHLGRRRSAPSRLPRLRSALPLAAGLRQSAAPRSVSTALSRKRTRAVRGVASCPVVRLCRSHRAQDPAWCGEAWLAPAEGLIAAPRQTMADLAAGGSSRAGQTSIGAALPGGEAGGWLRVEAGRQGQAQQGRPSSSQGAQARGL